jgi:hypothetical protein
VFFVGHVVLLCGWMVVDHERWSPMMRVVLDAEVFDGFGLSDVVVWVCALRPLRLACGEPPPPQARGR